MKNIYKTAGAALKQKLHAELEKLYRCKGTPEQVAEVKVYARCQ
eukprot:COSAG02_NODE_741_length_17813_cov_51.487863_1_plen_44_part_00